MLVPFGSFDGHNANMLLSVRHGSVFLFSVTLFSPYVFLVLRVFLVPFHQFIAHLRCLSLVPSDDDTHKIMNTVMLEFGEPEPAWSRLTEEVFFRPILEDLWQFCKYLILDFVIYHLLTTCLSQNNCNVTSI